MRSCNRKLHMKVSLRSWRNCICARSFGGEAAFLAALPREASAEGARKFRLPDNLAFLNVAHF